MALRTIPNILPSPTQGVAAAVATPSVGVDRTKVLLDPLPLIGILEGLPQPTRWDEAKLMARSIRDVATTVGEASRGEPVLNGKDLEHAFAGALERLCRAFPEWGSAAIHGLGQKTSSNPAMRNLLLSALVNLRLAAAIRGVPPETRDALALELKAGTPRPQPKVGDSEAAATLNALLATGTTVAEAFGMAANVHGVDELREGLVAHVAALAEWAPEDSLNLVMGLLDEVGALSPELATEGLVGFFEGMGKVVEGDFEVPPWALRLPEGMRIAGILRLPDRQDLLVTAKGFQVGGAVYVGGLRTGR